MNRATEECKVDEMMARIILGVKGLDTEEKKGKKARYKIFLGCMIIHPDFGYRKDSRPEGQESFSVYLRPINDDQSMIPANTKNAIVNGSIGSPSERLAIRQTFACRSRGNAESREFPIV